MKKYYLSACVLIRTINPFMLAELLLYHRLIGVEHFYIFDNRSIYDLSYILKAMNDVSLYICDGENSQESVLISVYNYCLNRCRDETEYLVFIDDDEFINFNDKYQSIPEIIKEFKEPDALMMNWLFMGCGNYRVRPFDKLMIESNTFSAKSFDKQTKGIYKTSSVLKFSSPHFGDFNEGARIIDGSGKVCPYPKGFHILTEFPVIWEHHYFIQSRNEFRLKCDRGHVVQANKRKFEEEIESNKDCSAVLNNMTQRWLNKLNEMGIKTPMDALKYVSGEDTLPKLNFDILAQRKTNSNAP